MYRAAAYIADTIEMVFSQTYCRWELLLVDDCSTAPRKKTTPATDAMVKGTVENAIIPSREYRKSFQNDHFVSPFLRSMFSYSSAGDVFLY